VVAVDYRGFADSIGTPSEKGLLIDARTLWDYVDGVKKGGKGQAGAGDVILAGLSLGTGVVSGLAGALADEGIRPRAIILGAPFTSVIELLQTYRLFRSIPLLSPLAYFPPLLRFLGGYLQHPFNSTAALAKTSSPILLLHARDDPEIPYHHSSNLFSSLHALTPSYEIVEKTYEGWGTIRSFTREKGGEVVWWDGLKGGHVEVNLGEGSVDLIRRVAGL